MTNSLVVELCYCASSPADTPCGDKDKKRTHNTVAVDSALAARNTTSAGPNTEPTLLAFSPTRQNRVLHDTAAHTPVPTTWHGWGSPSATDRQNGLPPREDG